MRFSRASHFLPALLVISVAPGALAQALGQSLAQQNYGHRVPPHLPTNTPVFPPGARPPPPLPAPPGQVNQTVVTPGGSVGSAERSGPDHAVVSKDGKFRLDFDKVELPDLVQNISDITGKVFILPDSLHGKISLIGPKHGGEWLTVDEVYVAFLSCLDANNIAIYQVGKYFKLADRRDASRRGIPTFLDDHAVYPSDEAFITKLFRLKHIDPDTVNGLLSDLLGTEGKSRPIQPDLLLVSEQAMNMHRIERIIDQIDVPGGGDEVRVIQVNYASATELVDKLTNIFTDKNKKPGAASRGISVPQLHGMVGGGPMPVAPSAPGETEEGASVNLTKAIADERTNKLIVIASPRSFDRIEAVIKQLDVPVLGESQIHVYYLSNAVADQVSTVLTSLIQGSSSARKPAAGAGGNANANPAANQSVFESAVKISPDKATNSLVIVATGADYTNLIKVIKQLDVPRRQVFVEAVIMEVNLDNELDVGGASHGVITPNIPGIGSVPIPLGAEPFPIGKGLNSLGGVQSLASLGGFLTGLQGPNNAQLAQVLNVSFFPSFAVLLQALQTSSDSNVLSTPHILASDNEDAEITVGQNVPFQSGFSFGGLGSFLGSGSSALGSSSTSGLGGLSSLPIGQIQRQNVELKLKIKPQINEGDYIRMTIDESTEEIASTDPVLGPTTSKRAAKTVIVAKDQETVVIGGLMQDRVIKSDNKTPLLGDIPVIGWLFRYNTTKKEKVNLLLFLTPYIIRSQADFRHIFERKMEERRQFVEEFYGDSVQYKVPIDFSRKTGPLGHMTADLRAEANKVENGGTGQGTGERTFAPTTGTLLQTIPEENAPPEAVPAPPPTPAPEGAAPPPPATPPAGEIPPPPNAPPSNLPPVPAPTGEAPAP